MSDSIQHHETSHEAPLLAPEHTFGSVTDKIASIVLARGLKRGWIVGLLISFLQAR